MNNKELKRNGSGCADPTAEHAIKHVTEKEMRVSKVIKTMQAVAHLAGFEVIDRIVLKDKSSGEVWR